MNSRMCGGRSRGGQPAAQLDEPGAAERGAAFLPFGQLAAEPAQEPFEAFHVVPGHDPAAVRQCLQRLEATAGGVDAVEVHVADRGSAARAAPAMVRSTWVRPERGAPMT